MKKTILKSALYSSLLIAVLSFTSCGKKGGDADIDTNGMETDSMEIENNEPITDTVVEDNDTIVKTGRGESTNPTGEQVP